MTTSLAILLALASVQGGGAASPPQTGTYTNEWIGISITHPSNWKVVPKKTDAWITIPLREGMAHAGLNVLAVTFNADPEIWQLSQKNTNVDMGLEVVRQWEEEILGVPLLLTKVRSGPGKLASAIKAVPELPADQPLVTLIGLVYSATPRKLLFRLTAPESAFDDAELALKKALESLRTTDGNLPKPEDPTRKPDPLPPPGKQPEGPPTKTTIGTGSKGPDPKYVRAPHPFEVAVAGRKAAVYYPDGWTLQRSEEGLLTLKSENPALTLKLDVHSSLDSDPPVRALIKLSAAGLKSFDKVASREENLPKVNKAGATYIRIWREGTGEKGELWSFEAVCGSPQYYCLVSVSAPGKPDPAARKALEALIEQMSVEPIE